MIIEELAHTKLPAQLEGLYFAVDWLEDTLALITNTSREEINEKVAEITINYLVKRSMEDR